MRTYRALTSIKHRPYRAGYALARVDGQYAVIIAIAMAPDQLRVSVKSEDACPSTGVRVRIQPPAQ